MRQFFVKVNVGGQYTDTVTIRLSNNSLIKAIRDEVIKHYAENKHDKQTLQKLERS